MVYICIGYGNKCKDNSNENEVEKWVAINFHCVCVYKCVCCCKKMVVYL